MRFRPQWVRGQATSPPLGVALGFLCGILVAALLIPDTTPSGGVITEGETAVPPDSTIRGVSGSGAGDVDATSGSVGSAASGASTGPASAPDTRGQKEAGGTAGTSSQGAAGAARIRGVTDTAIKIGVAYPDWSWAAAIKSNWRQGDAIKQMEAVLDRWKREGMVPVNGRQIEFVYRKVSVLDASDQRAACVQFIQDFKVFAVIAPGTFTAGRECVAGEFKTPVISDEYGSSTPDELVQRNAPYLFTLPMTTSRLMRNWVRWADEGGYLKGKRLGLYHLREQGVDPDYTAKIVKSELARRGYRLAAEAATSNGQGGPDDQLAAQRFRAAGVDQALLVVAIFNQVNFMQYADAQGYRPTYLDSDYIWSTHDHVSDLKPAAQYNGTLAMTAMHTGELGLGKLSPETEKCVGNYERFAQAEVPRGSSIEWANINLSCDVANVLLRGLQAAGRALTPLSFVRGLETNVRNVPMALHGNVTFTPDKHHGEDTWRTVRWDSACRTPTTSGCWKFVGDGLFRPLWVG